MRIGDELYNHANEFTSPHYLMNDGRHGMIHRDTVTARGQMFAGIAKENPSKRCVFVGTMYHDIGHHIDPKKHEEISAQMCIDDKKLRKFFTKSQIIEISEGIADHRASLPGDPRNIIGKIISSADRRVDMTDYLESTYTWRLKNASHMKLPEIIKDAFQYTCKKFGDDGYANQKMYFLDLEYLAFQDEIKEMINDKKLFKSQYLKMVDNYHRQSELFSQVP